MAADELTDLERSVLDLEARFYRHRARKEEAARLELSLTATRYAQILNSLVGRPAALAYAPTLVHRLQRLRRRRAS